MQVIEESSEEEDAIRVKVAKIHRFNNDLKSAISILTPDEDNDFLKLNRAYMYSEFREWEMLKKELNKIKRKNIKYDSLRQEYDFLSGKYSFINGDFIEARKHFTDASSYKNTYYFFEAIIKLAIIDLVFDDVDSAIIMTKNIINDKDIPYSSRNNAITLIGNAYLKIGDYDKAKETFDMLDEKYTRKNLEIGKLYLYSNNYEQAEELLEDFVNTCGFIHYDALFYLAIAKYRLEKYEEAYIIADNILKVTDKKKNEFYKIKIELERLKLYIDLIHNTPIRDNKNRYSYMESQIYSYSKEKTIQHIIDRHIGPNKTGSFGNDFPIEEVIELVPNLLDEKKKIACEFLDNYIIDYNSLGFKSDNNLAVKVLTIPNTKQIVNMYVLRINIDKQKEEELQPKKVKRMSQIEKFNLRYNKTQE